MSIPTTFYDVLNVSSNVNFGDIKLAYRQALLEAHPDRGGNVDRFSQVEQAWSILKDETARQIYDAKLREWTLRLLKPENLVVGEVVKLDEFLQNECCNVGREKDIYFFDCRCGGQFVIEKDSLKFIVDWLIVQCDICCDNIKICR